MTCGETRVCVGGVACQDRGPNRIQEQNRTDSTQSESIVCSHSSQKILSKPGQQPSFAYTLQRTSPRRVPAVRAGARWGPETQLAPLSLSLPPDRGRGTGRRQLSHPAPTDSSQTTQKQNPVSVTLAEPFTLTFLRVDSACSAFSVFRAFGVFGAFSMFRVFGVFSVFGVFGVVSRPRSRACGPGR